MVIFVSSSERVAMKFSIEQDTAVAVQFPDKARLHRQQKPKKLKARCAEKKMHPSRRVRVFDNGRSLAATA
jgi:hypothetical protein